MLKVQEFFSYGDVWLEICTRIRKGKFIIYFHSHVMHVIWWHQSLTFGFLFCLIIGTFALQRQRKKRMMFSIVHGQFQMNWNYMPITWLTFYIHSFWDYSKFGGDPKHLHEYKEGLGKIEDTLFTTMKIIEKYNILPHDDGDSMFSYIIWFLNSECFKPYLIISQVSVMLIMDWNVINLFILHWME